MQTVGGHGQRARHQADKNFASGDHQIKHEGDDQHAANLRVTVVCGQTVNPVLLFPLSYDLYNHFDNGESNC